MRAAGNPKNRFEPAEIAWEDGEAPLALLHVHEERSKTILSENDSPDLGFRFSHMGQPYLEDDAMGNFVPATANPALGNSPCNGMVYPPGTSPCQELGLAGGTQAENRSLVPVKGLWIAPRFGVA